MVLLEQLAHVRDNDKATMLLSLYLNDPNLDTDWLAEHDDWLRIETQTG
jgi:hypothetical protein